MTGDDNGNGGETGDSPRESGVVAMLGMYEEAKELLQETLDYFSGPGDPKEMGLEPEINLAYIWEAKQLTTQLMNVMAWLLTQRAVQEGEITPEEALGEDNRLGDPLPPLPVSEQHGDELPDEFRDLRQRCQNLYERLSKIDSQSRSIN